MARQPSTSPPGKSPKSRGGHQMPPSMSREDEPLIEMRCRSCGTYLGVRRRQGPFIFWCSEPCADTPMAKFPTDQIRDEVAVELYLSGMMGIMDIARFTETPYTRIQQLLYRRGIELGRPPRQKESA